MPRRFSRPVVISVTAVLTAALIGAGVGAVMYASFGNSSDATSPSSSSAVSSGRPAAQTQTTALSVSQIYRLASPGVVEITTTTGAGNSPYPNGGGTQQAQGSGFVYDSAGHIVTNEHVIDDATSINVSFSDGSTYKATLVGSDNSTDLAVLKVDAPQSKLHPLALANSSDLQVGDGVVAIGSPFGLENSVTSGIVSALHREIIAPNNFTITDAIQTDAAINHGNSGGALLDLLGRVIGVTAQIKSDSGGNEGVGFAVPSNTVHSVASKLISSGVVEHAYLGVQVQTISSDAASALGVPEGAEITQIRSGTPAASAGLKAASGQKAVNGDIYPTGGDVITKVDGQRIMSADELQTAIGAKSPGDQVSLTYVRSGSEQTVQVTLAKRPS